MNCTIIVIFGSQYLSGVHLRTEEGSATEVSCKILDAGLKEMLKLENGNKGLEAFVYSTYKTKGQKRFLELLKEKQIPFKFKAAVDAFYDLHERPIIKTDKGLTLGDVKHFIGDEDSPFHPEHRYTFDIKWYKKVYSNKLEYLKATILSRLEHDQISFGTDLYFDARQHFYINASKHTTTRPASLVISPGLQKVQDQIGDYLNIEKKHRRLTENCYSFRLLDPDPGIPSVKGVYRCINGTFLYDTKKGEFNLPIGDSPLKNFFYTMITRVEIEKNKDSQHKEKQE